MITIEVNLPIGNEVKNRWMAMWGEENVVFSLESVKRIFEENKSESDFTFNINCDGGYVSEGLAIYDYIRTSGKNIHCNILSGCHSMAVVLLLSAPLENRTANKHAMSLIHCVRSDVYDATAEDMERALEELKKSEDAILNIYADRTGEDIEVLRALMKEEKVRDAEFLLAHKFIGKINEYNTNMVKRVNNNNSKNQNQNTMAKTKNEALQMAKDCLSRIANLLGGSKNYDHTDNDGNVLFSTEVEDDTLEVGMNATPDGTFELPDGRTIIIADGVITEIKEKVVEDTNEEVENLQNEVANLTAEIENLRTQLNESAEVITELQSQLTSNYKPRNAHRTAPAKNPEEKNASELQAEHMEAQREKLGIKNSK